MIIAICLQKQNFSIYRLDKSGAGDWLVLLFSGKNNTQHRMGNTTASTVKAIPH